MSGLFLYSTNPLYATHITDKYLGGSYFAWVSDYFDASTAPSGSHASMIAPSSNPRRILRNLTEDVRDTDEHSVLIKGYCKTFKRLANRWHLEGKITKEERAEIIATANPKAFNQWQPVIYVIPRDVIESTGRLTCVPRSKRASYGPEMQVTNLRRGEFDVINLGLL